jgi:hypothetical protein
LIIALRSIEIGLTTGEIGNLQRSEKLKELLKIGFLLAVFGIVGQPDAATAMPLYTFFGDCSSASCFGSTYKLIIDNANDTNSTTYKASLIIDTTGYNGPGDYVDAVDFKVVNSVIGSNYALVSAPGGAGNWSIDFNSGQAANDCANGGGFKFCARDSNFNTLAPVGGILAWDWTFQSNDTIAFGHIGASYNNLWGTLNGNNTSISSARTVGALPIPGTMFLLGAGLIVLSASVRRLGRKQS